LWPSWSHLGCLRAILEASVAQGLIKCSLSVAMNFPVDCIDFLMDCVAILAQVSDLVS
jgi:hypothetical protein